MVNDIFKCAARTMAMAVNYVFHPILMPLYLFLILVLFSSLMINNTTAIKFVILKLVAFITIGTPIISLGSSMLIVRIMGEKSGGAHNHILSSSILAISYLLAIIILKDYLTINFVLRIMIAPLIIIVQYQLFRYIEFRFSLWTASIGALTCFMYLFSYYNIGGVISFLFLSILISGVVGSSRLYLRKETLKASAVGYVMGFAASVLSFIIGGAY